MAKSLSQLQLKLLELQYMEIEGMSIKRFTSQRQLAVPFKHSEEELSIQIQKMGPSGVLVFDTKSNNNLLAYGYLLLCLIYGEEMNQKLLVHVKSVLYPQNFDLKVVKGENELNISSQIMKKFFVELIFMLSFTDFTQVMAKKLEKYPVILYILAVFLRCVLVLQGFPQAANYEIALKTSQIIPILNNFFEIDGRTIENIHLFTQNHRFIKEEDGRIFMGIYKDEPIPMKDLTVGCKIASSLTKQGSGSNQIDKRNKNSKFQDGNKSSINNDFDGSTPFFNLGSENQQRYKDSFRNAEEQPVIELNNYASVPNFLTRNIVEVNQHEATRDADLLGPSTPQRIERSEEKGNYSLLEMPNFSSDYKELNATHQRFSRSSSKFRDLLKKNRKSEEKTDAVKKHFQVIDISEDGSCMIEQKLIKWMDKCKCLCMLDKKKRLILCSRLYEINLIYKPFEEEQTTLSLHTNSPDRKLSRYLDRKDYELSLQYIRYPASQRQKIRTETSYESSISMERSYESLFQTFPAFIIDTPKITRMKQLVYHLPKESDYRLQKSIPSFKKPLIKFTYSNCRV